jgi:hypothetical protein
MPLFRQQQAQLSYNRFLHNKRQVKNAILGDDKIKFLVCLPTVNILMYKRVLRVIAAN